MPIDLDILLSDAWPVTLSKEAEKIAAVEYRKYLKTKSIEVDSANPLTIYYIIRDLSSEEQVKFIKDNIEYIRKHDSDIFLYNMLEPSSLSKHLSYDAINEIYNLDKSIFRKIINGGSMQFLYSFSEEEVIKFFDVFHDEIVNYSDRSIVNMLSYVRNHHFQLARNKNLYETIILAKEYDKKFIDFVMKRYKDFYYKEENLLSFLALALDMGLGKENSNEFILANKEKIKKQIGSASLSVIYDCLEDVSSSGQRLLLTHFLDDILDKGENVVNTFNSDVLAELYRKDPMLVKRINLKNIIGRFLDDDVKEIVSYYNIDSVEELFMKTNCFHSTLKYVEDVFRGNIKIDGTIKNIADSSVFSNEYLKNLKEFKELFRAKKITRKNELYKDHFALFLEYLIDNKKVKELDEISLKEIEKLFYRVIGGASIVCLKEVSSIEEITLLNRIGKLDFWASNFTVNQLSKYNVREHEKLCKMMKDMGNFPSVTKTCLLKLMFLVGYERAAYILSLDNSVVSLEHLVGNVDVKNVKLDSNGDPILNTKIMNLLFKDLKRNRIQLMLENKESDLYKYFPRIFNEWKNIEISKKDKSLSAVIEFLKGIDVSLLPKYYRLDGIFKYIGCGLDVVEETLKLHDEIINRKCSSIPRVKGDIGEYSYEVLRLDDVKGLAVGSMTQCCFTVKGAGYSSLKHALTSPNGRILVVKKDGALVAHSWLWRNGNVLCLDNIEVIKEIKEIDFLDVYLKFAEDVMKKSLEAEGKEKCIQNVMLGVNSFDQKIDGINECKCYINKTCDYFAYNKNTVNFFKAVIMHDLPFIKEKDVYSDSRMVQYLLKGEGNFKFYDATPCYGEKRNEISYVNGKNIDDEVVSEINKVVNCLRYLESEEKKTESCFESIDIRDYKEVYCNSDWFVLVDKNNDVYKYIYGNDGLAREESETILNNLKKRIKTRK